MGVLLPHFKLTVKYIATWKKPMINFIKINTDELVLQNGCDSDDIFRYTDSNVVLAFASPFTNCFVIMDKLKADNIALSICLQRKK